MVENKISSDTTTQPNSTMMMKAALCQNYGPVDEVLTVVEDALLIPTLKDLPKKQQRNHMIIRTLAVALAPGDCRVLSGKTKELQGPSKFPYVPGGDCCGIVIELPPPIINKKGMEQHPLPFKVGDIVGCGFMNGKPAGALGEYAIVNSTNADRVPPNITPVQAAALVGANPAVVACGNYQRIREGDRVLVLGAGGGMGSMICQVARNVYHASYVVGVTSKRTELLESVCHELIDYNTTNVNTIEKYINTKFDVIFDVAGYGYDQLLERSFHPQKLPIIVKSAEEGGRFITLVAPIGPMFEAHSIPQMIKEFLWPCLVLAFKSRFYPSYRQTLPKYTFALDALTFKRQAITNIFQLASTGKIQPVVDPKGPFPFTTEGVRTAFQLQESRHPYGKVVIEVSSLNKTDTTD